MALSRALAADGEQITNTERLVTSALAANVKAFLPAVGDGSGATVAFDATIDVYANSTGTVEVVDVAGRRIGPIIRPGEGRTLQATGNAAQPGWLSQEITKFYQKQRGVIIPITYSATMATDASLADTFTITATDTVAFTISNPTNGKAGDQITYIIKNASGGVQGTITWGAAFKVAAWVKPATGFNRSITFLFDGTNWVEVGRGANDIAN
jgi:hypothetical protein